MHNQLTMDITSRTLEKFGKWLVERGRSEDTARIYQSHLLSCSTDAKGLTHRLVKSSLSPNTRRCNLAALHAWAKYSQDTDLRTKLDDIRLPPARRVKAKIPLEFDHWREFVQHLQVCDVTHEPMRQVMLIIAKRGMRCGDVLRMKRSAVVNALESKVIVFEGKGRKVTRFAAGPILPELKVLAKLTNWSRVRDLVTKGKRPGSAVTRIERAMKRYAQEIELTNVHPHRFRTTYATSFLKQLKGDPQALIKLQRHMDWESLATAAMYADAVETSELDVIGAGLTHQLTK